MNAQIQDATTSFNGIDALTGLYLPSPSVEDISKALRGELVQPVNSSLVAKHYSSVTSLGLPFDVDGQNLEEAGWCLLLAHDGSADVFDALLPLRRLREEQAAGRYKVFKDALGYRREDTVAQWLGRQGAEVGMPQVAVVPYYVLIVGGPDVIPFSFQYELSVNYAVGRLHFDSLDGYRHYAASVVAGESAAASTAPKRASFFGVCNDDDRATKMSRAMLVEPLALALEERHQAAWKLERVFDADATKAGLAKCLQSSPALLFTASHGMAFPNGHENQVAHQGALLCQDWTGPLAHRGAIDSSLYFAGDDVPDSINLTGMVTFHFACYGAGTPRYDEFGPVGARAEIAGVPFIAGLPQRLLGKPDGGALAVIGHVERAWSYSFASPDFGTQTRSFEECLHALMSGLRIGAAMDAFAMRHAALAVGLNRIMDDIRHGARIDDHKVAGQWTMHNDARNYLILGDPAVRITTRRSQRHAP